MEALRRSSGAANCQGGTFDHTFDHAAMPPPLRPQGRQAGRAPHRLCCAEEREPGDSAEWQRLPCSPCSSSSCSCACSEGTVTRPLGRPTAARTNIAAPSNTPATSAQDCERRPALTAPAAAPAAAPAETYAHTAAVATVSAAAAAATGRVAAAQDARRRRRPRVARPWCACVHPPQLDSSTCRRAPQRGWSRKSWRLQPYVIEAATVSKEAVTCR